MENFCVISVLCTTLVAGNSNVKWEISDLMAISGDGGFKFHAEYTHTIMHTRCWPQLLKQEMTEISMLITDFTLKLKEKPMMNMDIFNTWT